ncbi:hypothetical protein GSI_02125 [Ganoderma sinense ZZ0214-1]|uniref:NAD-dependent epimerase/dehydratase domain-containing protein n=1 Tax=Ganoderma sinense ZZ0214-1 TaxID=1077348 RepID=A0A2G8SNS5_9APHY|nr:hypothetical protein GSI_02125 [Ganoderma sinense ZZ0214-1]
MKLAVTGCNGDIGSRVILAALSRGHTVLGIDVAKLPDVLTHLPEDQSARFAFYEADLRDYEAATKLLRGCEGIVHLAAMRTPGDYHVNTHNTNVVISWNILRAAAELGINRVAQASSVNVIPLVWTDRKDFEYFPLDEDHPTRTRVDEPYGLSKVYVPNTPQLFSG